MNWIRKVLECAVLLGTLICASPLEATTVSQSGSITPTHAACWTTTGVIQDCGTAAVPYLTTFGVLGGPLCLNSAVNTGPYNALCLSVATAGPAQISLQNYGGATAQQLQFVLNGTTATFATETGSFTAGNLACFQNTAGVLLDCGLSGVLGTMAYQNANAVAITGGTITGLTGLAIRDTSTAFDVTIGATSSTPLTAGRSLTIDMVNGARTLKLGSNLTLATDPGGITGALKSNGSGTFAQAACSDLSDGATGCSTTVGTMATQNANTVAITGGTLANITNIGVANTGSWPNTTINDIMRVAVGGFPITAEAGGNILGTTQAVVGAVDIGAADTSTLFSSGVSGYARTNNGTSAAVGVYSQATMNADGGFVWGTNPVVTNAPLPQYTTNTGYNFQALNGAEVDINIVKRSGVAPTGSANGILITGASEVQPTLNFAAITVTPAGIGTPNIPWKHILLSSAGASQLGIALGALTTANSQSSQPLYLYGTNAGGTPSPAILFADLNGILNVTMPGGTIMFPNATDTLIGKATAIGITNFALRDTSAAFDVTLAATSSTALTAGRTLTLDLVNAARTLKLAGNLTASASATVSGTNTGDANVATTAVTTNADFFPLFVASSSNSTQVIDLSTTYKYNPSTGVLNLNLSTGAIAINNITRISDVSGVYTTFSDGSAGAAFLLGGVGDPTNYSTNTTHVMRDRAGTTTFLTINSTGATFSQKIFAPSLATTTAALAAALCWTVTTGEFQRDTNASGCLVSAARYKHNVHNLPSMRSTILAMRPVSFDYNDDVGIKGNQIGFIADEMVPVERRLVGFNDNGQVQSFKYMQSTAVLAKGLQETFEEIDDIKREFSRVKANNDNLRHEFEQFKRRASR